MDIKSTNHGSQLRAVESPQMETIPFLQSSSIPMEFEEPHLLLQPSFGQCSLQTHEGPIFPIITQDAVLDDGFMDTLLYFSEEHPNVDLMVHDSPIVEETVIGIEQGLPMGCEIVGQDSQQRQQDDFFTEEGENFNWKGIQDELMEENSLTDLLLTGAEAVEMENWQLASAAIARLNNILSYQATNPFHRLAYFFTQGLQSRTVESNGSYAPAFQLAASNDMSAYQMVQELSPYMKFAHFTANQAILEAIDGDPVVHIIDFDVMEGIQWPPLMVDLSLRKETSLRITAIVDKDNAIEVQRTGRRLLEFAESIGLCLRFDQLLMEEEEDLGGIQEGDGPLIANCIVHQLHTPSRSLRSVKSFLGGVKKLSPKMVVLVEEELLLSSTKTPSFVEFFCEALHHFSALSESLVSSFYGGYKVGLRLVEKELLGPRIVDCVGQFPYGEERKVVGGGLFSCLEGFKPIPLSACNVSQAKFLVGLFNRGYGIQHDKCRLALCWKSRPLTTVSVWVPT